MADEPGTGSADPPATQEALPGGRKVVAIGASTGGLVALRRLLAELPEAPGAAFVVVVHLSPEHKSYLADLLQPHCRMPVHEVTATVSLETNRVYVIPPNANLEAVDTHLRLSELEARRIERAPIDHFFRTLARHHDGTSMGIVLTGEGTDGTLGIRRIRELGGVTVAQDPAEAEAPSMPRSAIASGMIDRVLPLDGIAQEIRRFAALRPRLPADAMSEAPHASRTERGAGSVLEDLYAEFRALTGENLDRYRRVTVLHRLWRRMHLRGVETLDDYLAELRRDDEEAQALKADLLVTVTAFFRDPEIYAALEQRIVPELFVRKRREEDRIRIWSVGCSTGEEAYSLAMVVLEEAERRGVRPNARILASDVHEAALHRAREGLYPEEIAIDMSTERLERYFVREKGRYRARRELRDLVVFAAHNVLDDPPYSRMDLVVCRNLLFYLQRDIRRDVTEIFHYALETDGLLLLGKDERVDREDLFDAEGDGLPLYRKREVPTQEPRLPVLHPGPVGSEASPRSREQPGAAPGSGLQNLRMAGDCVRPGVIVNDAHEVVHYSDKARRFLRLPGGEPTHRIFDLLREPLARELRRALAELEATGEPVRRPPVAVETDSGIRRVALWVRPDEASGREGHVLVAFDETERDDGRSGGPAGSGVADAAGPADTVGGPVDRRGDDSGSGSAAEALQARLSRAERELNAMHAGRDRQRHRFDACHDKLESTNEELAALAAELENAKGSLQSANEELVSVSNEHHRQVDRLTEAAAELESLFSSMQIAALILDRELKIVLFSPEAAKLFNLRRSDRGRSLSDLANRLDYPELADDARRVLRDLRPVQRAIACRDDRTYLARIGPWRGANDSVAGVAIMLVDTKDDA